MSGALSYPDPGATEVAEPVWRRATPRFRRFERTVVIGRGDRLWSDVSAGVLEWAIKTGSGFAIAPAPGDGLRVREGADLSLVAHVGPLRIREPIRIVAVVELPDRVGFAYGTRAGHPVAGEEAFVVHRDAAGTVSLTLRSLTRAPRGPWRLLFPVSLVAQRFYRRRYLAALRSPA
jgi:uncharacterized protein (UPF0548 family)